MVKVALIGAGSVGFAQTLVKDILLPPIGLLLGGVDFSDLKLVLKNAYVNEAGTAVPEVVVRYGSFINTVIDFLIVAFVIFMLIKLMNMAKKKQEAAPAPAPAPSKEELLLTDIRDILKNK